MIKKARERILYLFNYPKSSDMNVLQKREKLEKLKDDHISIVHKGVRSLPWYTGLVILSLLCIATVGFAGPSVFYVQMDGFSPYYVPKSIEIPTGTSVMWKNPTSTHHTITHDGCRGEGLCVFDSGAIAPNGKFGLYGLPAGHYSYHCTLHPIMRGTLVVAGTSTL